MILKYFMYVKYVVVACALPGAQSRKQPPSNRAPALPTFTVETRSLQMRSDEKLREVEGALPGKQPHRDAAQGRRTCAKEAVEQNIGCHPSATP